MTVKTITITQQAYEQLKGRKMPSESFSEVILRTLPKKATAIDWFGICPGTEAELKTELKALKEQRRKMDREIEERRIKYALG